ncbi:UDP-N-acetylmuramoyl-tripeptide--D-alanyl-D-alanine ligase [Lapidilactobacillus bayanensis]|uniref:UDP-N-acetylmuramoyl-tripeptide--D-alanyl-D- alanine ligase n=1 Tax=Lapidilactobacillus bayanensis TaxID=2485998 RepID=UPI000F7B21A1|nr:UDP-N-acetylmuramoyl-tripeptide--D-alanyl-D-alanine ligase [Lapidilactobacillus bayanensis]
MKMTLAEIAQAVGATISEVQQTQFSNVVINNIAIDSRKATQGSLFVPLVGRRDGHEFVDSAQRNGASATFWQTGHADRPNDISVIEVADPLTALQELAKYYLMKVNPQVIAVTGSNGKTTTKDMIAAILATQNNTAKTQGNHNNAIGVPLTILGMETNTEILVVEMGMDHFGQLTFLSDMVKPDLAVITMIGEAHIEFFGTRDKIADAKMEITSGLKEDGTLIINGDEPLLTSRAAKWEPMTFGFNDDNYLYKTSMQLGSKRSEFTVNKWPKIEFSIPMMGEFNVMNALAALTVGRRFHIKPETMAAALATFQPTENRNQWLKSKSGAMILSDVYNSNPTAVHEVLQGFVAAPTVGQHIVVLGDMLELGEKSGELHAGLATDITPDQIQQVYLYGPEMAYLYQALQSRYSETTLHYYDQSQQAKLIQDLQAAVTAADLVLLKASNGMHFDQVLKELM